MCIYLSTIYICLGPPLMDPYGYGSLTLSLTWRGRNVDAGLSLVRLHVASPLLAAVGSLEGHLADLALERLSFDLFPSQGGLFSWRLRDSGLPFALQLGI